MTSWARSYRSATYENLIVPQIELVFQEIVHRLCILKNLLRPLLGLSFVKVCLILVYAVARVLHADNIDSQFLNQLAHQWLSQGNVFSVCVEMDHDFLALTLEEEARYEVVRIVLFEVPFVFQDCFFFVHLVQIFTKFILIQEVLSW